MKAASVNIVSSKCEKFREINVFYSVFNSLFFFQFVTFRYLENRDKHIGIVLLTIDTQNLYSQIRNNICDKIEIQTMIK